MLAIVFGLIDTLAPGQRFAVAGFSYGALLARGAVHQAAERMAGVLLAVSPVTGSQLPGFRVRHTDESFTRLLEPGEQDKLDWVVWQTPEVLESIRETVDVGLPLADTRFFDRLGGSRFSSFDVDAPPNRFEAPSLIVAGRFDHWCGYDGMYALLPDYPLATYAVLDGGGHGAYLERPDLFRALVHDWLERVATHEAHKP
jgi:pimeloyl-ACP methyl ester carboxylesterase